jgi:hypothetical protein
MKWSIKIFDGIYTICDIHRAALEKIFVRNSIGQLKNNKK